MNTQKKTFEYKLATLAGIAAVFIWSSNVAVSKTVMDKLGAFNSAFYIYFFSGILNFIFLFFYLGKSDFFSRLKNLPLSYYLYTGSFFVMNNVFLYLAIGLARKDEELLIVTLLNYLWPVMIFIFRVPIYRLRIIPVLFYPAIAAALTGIVIALLQGYTAIELLEIAGSLNDNLLAFLFAFLGAVSWALYSNLIRKYKSDDDIVGFPLIFIVSGLVFFIIQILRGESASLSLEPVYSDSYLIYTILGPTCIGYLFWFLAMKFGNRALVSSLSYLIPLGSVFLVSHIHNIPVTPMFWVSALLLVIAAVLGIQAVKKGHDS